MTLEEYIAQLQQAAATVEATNVKLLAAAIEDLKNYGQAIGHQRSGRMVRTMRVSGPYPVGDGAYEASFESGATYADDEVLRGGEHDWAVRTINEERPRITQLQFDAEEALIVALVGTK